MNKESAIIMHFNFGFNYLIKDVMHYRVHYE